MKTADIPPFRVLPGRQQFTRRVALRFELRTLNIADPQDATGDGRELDYRATLKLQWILAY